MNMDINDSTCWVYGNEFIIGHKDLHPTKHHTLPKHLNPVKNITVPSCKKCHRKINAADVRGIFAFAYKLDKSIQDVKRMTGDMWDSVSSYFNKGDKNESKKNKN